MNLTIVINLFILLSTIFNLMKDFILILDLWDIKHHRHWQKAFEMIADSNCKFSMLPSMIPKLGTILGGNITLHGNNLTLACFHGINFRSKSWALFCLNEAFIVFATEAQKSQDGSKCLKMFYYVGKDISSFLHLKNF